MSEIKNLKVKKVQKSWYLMGFGTTVIKQQRYKLAFSIKQTIKVIVESWNGRLVIREYWHDA